VYLQRIDNAEIIQTRVRKYCCRVSGAALVRPRRGRIVAGVCAGIAQRFGVSPSRVRLLFILSMLPPGPQVLLYIALWIVIPET
jgi:phage shock protein PspC (stress-responsive transcriptional regulator)